MMIQVPITHYEEIELTEKQEKEITASTIRKICDIPDDPFIRDNTLFNIEEHCTSHRYDVDVEVRKATELDNAALQVLGKLFDRNYVRDSNVDPNNTEFIKKNFKICTSCKGTGHFLKESHDCWGKDDSYHVQCYSCGGYKFTIGTELLKQVRNVLGV